MYRITNGMIAANTLRNISAAAVRLAKANEAVASNMKIQLASDDPTVATRAVTYRSTVSQIEQYQDNADLADAWQTTTDNALSSLNKVITSLKEIATAASSDTVTADDLENYATQVATYLQNIVTYMNADESGSYVFGGYSTSEEPYELVTTDIGDTVTFKGQYLSLGGVISSDVSDDDIKSFITASASDIYDSLSDAADDAYTAYTTAQTAATADSSNIVLAAKAASALATYNTLNTAVSTYGGTTNLTDAAAAAENTVDTLTTAITTYGGTTTLATAAADALSTSTTLSAEVTTYGSYTLTAAASEAKSAYETANAADPTSSTTTAAKATYDALEAAITTYGSTTTVSEAAEAAEATSDTLAAAVTTYGGSTTLTNAAASAEDTADVLAATVADSDQDITYNVGFSTEVTVNVEGQDVTGEGTDNLFNTIQKLLLALNGDTTYKTVSGVDSSGTAIVDTIDLNISDLIDEFSTALNRVTDAQATVGASMDRVSNVSDRLDDAYEAYRSLMTDNENIDTAVAATELTSAEYTYEAALAVGAKVISKTLIDYIA